MLSSISPLQEHFSASALLLQNRISLAPVDTATDILKALVSTTTIPPGVFKIFDFEKTEYRAGALNADYSAQAVRVADLGHVEKVRTMVCEGRCVNDFGSLSVAEKNPLLDPLSIPPSAADGKLSVPLYLLDGSHCRALSKIVDEFGTD